jgi:hypothetical protein
MRTLPLILALVGCGLFLVGVLSLFLAPQPNELHATALCLGLGMVVVARLIQLVAGFDVRRPLGPSKRGRLTRRVPPAWAWGVLVGMVLVGAIAVCWVTFFAQ